MKKMICDICGSSEILKHENVFLCKSCGCMYSLEEAKKLLRNIPDEEKVPNIIKPGDSSRDHVEKLRSLARRAKKQNDARSGADYYRQLLTEDPNDWEAAFYSTFYEAHNCKIAGIGEAANRVSASIGDVFRLLKEHEPELTIQKNALNEIFMQICNFKQLLIVNAIDHLGSNQDTAASNFRIWVIPALNMMLTLGDEAVNIFDDYELAYSAYNLVCNDVKTLSECNQMNMTFEEFSQPHPFTYMASVTDDLPRMATIAEKRIANLSLKKQEKEAAAKQARLDAYWAEHSGQRTELEKNRNRLEETIKALDLQIRSMLRKKDEVPAAIEYAKAQEERNCLIEHRNNLGLLKFKEKKAIQVQIDAIETRLLTVREEMEDQQNIVQSEIEPLIDQKKSLQNQRNEIIAELTRER